MSAELFRKLQITNSRLVSVNKKLKAEISKLKKTKKGMYINITNRQQASTPDSKTIQRRKAKIKSILTVIDAELSKIGYKFDEIYILEKANYRLENSDFIVQYREKKRDSQYHTDLKCLYYKDLAGMSDKAYSIFRKGISLNSKISPLSRLKRLRKTYSIVLNATALSTGKFSLRVLMFLTKY